MIFQDYFFWAFVSRLSTTCSSLCGTRLSTLGRELPIPFQGCIHAQKVLFIYKLSPELLPVHNLHQTMIYSHCPLCTLLILFSIFFLLSYVFVSCVFLLWSRKSFNKLSGVWYRDETKVRKAWKLNEYDEQDMLDNKIYDCCNVRYTNFSHFSRTVYSLLCAK